MELRQDLFIIPIRADMNIVYAPMRNTAFYANSDATVIVEKYKGEVCLSDVEKNTQVWDYLQQLEKIAVTPPESKRIGPGRGVVILLSQMCNLACSYCYAQESRSKEALGVDKLETIIDASFTKGKSVHIRKY